MSAICSRCSPSSSITTTVIDLIARWICKRQYRADQSRMASLLVERFSADFITRTAGLHDRCTFAALQPLAKVDAVGTGAVRACDDEEGENGARPAQDPNSKQRPFTPPRVPGEIVPRQLRNPHLFQVQRDIGQVLFSHSRSRFTDRWASPRW